MSNYCNCGDIISWIVLNFGLITYTCSMSEIFLNAQHYFWHTGSHKCRKTGQRQHARAESLASLECSRFWGFSRISLYSIRVATELMCKYINETGTALVAYYEHFLYKETLLKSVLNHVLCSGCYKLPICQDPPLSVVYDSGCAEQGLADCVGFREKRHKTG